MSEEERDDGDRDQAPAGPHVGPRRRRFLILEDDPAVRRVWLRMAASRQDVEVIVVATADEVRALWAEAEPAFDLVVCDYHLGGGATSAELVRGLHDAGAPVVVLSGDASAARAGVASAHVPVLAKPMTVSGLLAMVERGG